MKIAVWCPFTKLVTGFFPNFWPVSIHRCFSKFPKRIIYNRILSYHYDFYSLCEDHSGFRENCSQLLLIYFLTCAYDKISYALDRVCCWNRWLLDLSKAFDRVSHENLFDNHYHYGDCGLALERVKSYFNERSQFVEYNVWDQVPMGSVRSSVGLRKGSILGPLFFYHTHK